MDIFNKLMNIHNHTYWSDGDNTPEEIIQNSLTLGMDVVGISDHLDDLKGYKLSSSNIHRYIKEVKDLSRKYPIEVFCGVEVSVRYLIKATQSLHESCSQLDFVLIEDIEFLSDSFELNALDNIISLFSCPVGLAHTNLNWLSHKYSALGGLSYVIDFVKRNNLFWEINASNVYGFFDNIIYRQFKSEDVQLLSELKNARIKVAVGSDTHNLDALEKGRLSAANEIAREMNQG